MKLFYGAMAALLWGGVLMLAGVPVSEAAEWSVEPFLSLREEFNDNILLTTLPHKAVWGTIVSPGLTMNALTETVEIKGNASMNFSRYAGESGLNTTDQFFRLSSLYREDRNIWGLEGALTRDSTLLGELSQTGLVNAREQRDLRTVNPTWRRQMSEATAFQVGYQFMDVAYADGGAELVDFQAHVGTGGLSIQLSEKDQVRGTAYYTNFQAPLANLRSSYYGGQVGMTRRFSETLRGTVSGGVRAVSSTTGQGLATRRDQELVWLAEANVEKQFERTIARASFNRDINPSGAGLLVRTDHASLSLATELTPTMTVSLAADAYWIEAIGTDARLPNSQYYRIEPSWRWRWTEWWSLDVSYAYARRSSDTESRAADANSAYVTITYRGFKVEPFR